MERIFGKRGTRQERKIQELAIRTLFLFDQLPEQRKNFPADPSWIEISPEDIRELPTEDLAFLVSSGKEWQTARVCALIDGQESWVGIRVNNLRVRYSEKDSFLNIIYEKKESEGGWEELSQIQTQDWDSFETALEIGESVLRRQKS